MSAVDAETRTGAGVSVRSHHAVHFAIAASIAILYVTAFWGQAAQLLPAPFDGWHSLPYSTFGPAWHATVAPGLDRAEQVALFQLLEGIVLAVAFPFLLLRLGARTWADAGVRAAEPGYGKLIAATAVVSILAGFVLSRLVADPWSSPTVELLGALTVIPEHFLLFGFIAAFTAPEFRLCWVDISRPARWGTLGLCALLFVLVHVGTPHPSELVLSFPLGLLYAYTTMRTRSIWPALVAHWLLNAAPMAWDAI